MKKQGGKILNTIGFVAMLYFFVFSLTLIKVSSQSLGNGFLSLTKDGIGAINAFGFGWLATLITQSSGAAAATLIAFSLAGFIGPIVLIYMMIGTRIGTSVTALFVAFLIHAKRRDFRHGFEVGIANLVYAFPIAIAMFLLEFFTGFFSRAGNHFIVLGLPTIDFVDMITLPLINFISLVPPHLNIILGLFVLVGSLKYLPKFMINIWGEAYLKQKINKFLNKKWKSFWFGFGITALLMSTSITITFLIPLVVTRITNLRKVIPYMIGANLGGVSELMIGGLVLGSDALPAIFTYVSFSAIGLLWMFKPDWLFHATKFLSKRTLNVSRKRALTFIVIFILMAVILSFI
ncbi:MAG: hypothetical protein KKB29_01440 [Nanoarchaeota archaeon]|nr:hypothetical protein [Nanoarchaeota archaeon]